MLKTLLYANRPQIICCFLGSEPSLQVRTEQNRITTDALMVCTSRTGSDRTGSDWTGPDQTGPDRTADTKLHLEPEKKRSSSEHRNDVGLSPCFRLPEPDRDDE